MEQAVFYCDEQKNIFWDRQKACAFTGHRLKELPFTQGSREWQGFAYRMNQALDMEIKRGMTTFLCGMAQGADLLMGEGVIEKKQEYPLTLVAACPYPGQAQSWGKDQQAQYQRVLKNCDYVYYLCRTYEKGSFHLRNRFMVDHSNRLLAAYDGRKKGGTYYTLTYAKQKGSTIGFVPLVDQIGFL